MDPNGGEADSEDMACFDAVPMHEAMDAEQRHMWAVGEKVLCCRGNKLRFAVVQGEPRKSDVANGDWEVFVRLVGLPPPASVLCVPVAHLCKVGFAISPTSLLLLLLHRVTGLLCLCYGDCTGNVMS